MSTQIEIGKATKAIPSIVYQSVVGYLLVAVVKQEDGALTIERDISVTSDNKEDNDVVEGFIKSIEAKLNEILPKPDFVVYDEQPKLWLPS